MTITLDDLYEVLERPHRYGNYIAACCAFHDDQSPSMLVFEDGFHCSACGKGGSLNYLYEKLTGRGAKPKVQVKPKAGRGNMWGQWLNRFDTVSEICRVGHKYLREHPSPYLKERKIQSKVNELGIGFMDAFYLFPLRDRDGIIIGATARASPTIQTRDTRWLTSPDCHSLYVPDWEKCIASDCLYVVFGIFDAIGLSICGLPVLTGVTGTSLDPDLLAEFGKPIFVIPDRKEERQALNLIQELGWRGWLLTLEYPDDCKDTADIREKYDDETLIHLIETERQKSIITHG